MTPMSKREPLFYFLSGAGRSEHFEVRVLGSSCRKCSDFPRDFKVRLKIPLGISLGMIF